jgi:hypothetical protein
VDGRVDGSMDGRIDIIDLLTRIRYPYEQHMHLFS